MTEIREAELAQVTLQSIGDGVIRIDARGRVGYMNPTAERLTGWRLADASGRDITEVYPLVSETTRRPRENPVVACLAERTTQTPGGLFILRGRHGKEATVRDSISPLLSQSGQLIGAVVVFRDLTHVRTLERQMAYLASHDPLTGLLNRQDFEIYLEAALDAVRKRGELHALLHLDLVELKLVNDCYGHVAGDELLRQIAELLRQESGERAVLARLVGSDFTVLLEGTGERRALAVAQRIQKRLGEFRFVWAKQALEIGLQIGVVPVEASCPSVAHLLRAADAACHHSRRSGRGRVNLLDHGDQLIDEYEGQLHWVQRIRQALSADRFVLYHQRIEALGELPSLHEILIRMVDDAGQPIAPGRFIPIAENHDMAQLIDRWVLRKTFEHLSAEKDFLGGDGLTINLSGQTLSDEVFLGDLIHHLETQPIDTSRLFFEITETHTVANLSRALRFIRRLKEMGCRFVLDDFGTGFASFAFLRSLPVDVVKIDGQFVREATQDPVARAMVASINEISHLMDLTTIAEWIEDDDTLGLVREMGVDYAQGFRLHRPAPLS